MRKSTEELAAVNPYSKKIHEFPGRIFALRRADDSSEQFSILTGLISTAEQILLELGSGSGEHLIGRAKQLPLARCFGFELRYKRAVRTLEKAQGAELENVYVVQSDAKGLARFFSPASISRLYVNFPDPWDKKKQAKYRLLDQWLAEAAVVYLRPEGTISIKTDHEAQFDRILSILSQTPELVLQWQTRDLYRSEYLAENVATEFEKMFHGKGMPIYGLEFKRAK